MRSWLMASGWATDEGVHMKELRNVFACLDSVIRKELLEDADERFDAVVSAALSAS